MFNKLKWAYRLLRTNTYVVLTDKESAVNIPLSSLDSFDNVFLLNAQQASLKEFRDRIEDVIHEHEEAVRLLSGRSVKRFGKSKVETTKKGKASR